MEDQQLFDSSQDDVPTSNLSQPFSSFVSNPSHQSQQDDDKFDQYGVQQIEILRIITEQLTKCKNQILQLTKQNQQLQSEIKKQNTRIEKAEGTIRQIQQGMIIQNPLPVQHTSERELEKDENETVLPPSSPILTNPILPEPNEVIPFRAPLFSKIGITIVQNNIPGLSRIQLLAPSSVVIDEKQTIYISDTGNHRIVACEQGSSHARVVFGFSGPGNKMSQLRSPLGLFYDKQDCSLIICDHGNCRILQWSPTRNTIQARKLIENVKPVSVAMDSDRNLYVIENQFDQVRKYHHDDLTQSKILIGDRGMENGLNRLNSPQSIFITENNVLYITDSKNNRIMKWLPDATEGQIVVGNDETGTEQTEISQPHGIIVDAEGTIYVSEWGRHCVSRWREGQKLGEIIIGERGRGSASDQLNYPTGLTCDQHGNLYVVDHLNNRVQIFITENED